VNAEELRLLCFPPRPQDGKGQDTQAGFWHNAGYGRYAKLLRGGPAPGE